MAKISTVAAVIMVFAGCVSAAPAEVGNPNFKYVGFWQSDNYTSELAGWANFLFFESNSSAFRQWRADGFNILWNVESNFFTSTAQGLVLRSDYVQSWAAVVANATPLLANGTIFGFFLGDELTWNGLPYSALLTTVNTVRASFPSATIYYNEAYPVFTEDKNSYGGTIGYNAVPTGLNWISIDFYPNEGPFTEAQTIYKTLLYPKMTASQFALYVPPAYGTATDPQAFCGNADCATAMVQWADDSYVWAQNDARLVGLAPWHWHSYPSSEVRGFEIGARDMPTVVAEWKKIAQSVRSRWH